MFDVATGVGAVGIAFTGVAAFALLGLVGLRYAKRHPQSKLNALYGTNKPIETAEFDEEGANLSHASLNAIGAKKKTWRQTYGWIDAIYVYYEWNAVQIWFNSLYVLCNVAVWLYGWGISLGVDPAPYYEYAKGFGKMLDMNLSFILIPVMRNILSFLRTTPLNEVLPFDDNLKIHHWTAYVIALSAVGHITCHYLDFAFYQNAQAVPIYMNALATRPGVTGQIVLFLMFCMYVTALIKRKIWKVCGMRIDGYKIFLHVHKLWVPVYAVMWIHGSLFWSYSVFPLAFMALEKYIQLRRIRLELKIVEARMSSRDVLSLKMRLANKKAKKFHYKAG